LNEVKRYGFVGGMPEAVQAQVTTGSLHEFKAILLDVGLWQHLSGMKVAAEYAREDLLSVYRGSMAEQFVGQEMAVSQTARRRLGNVGPSRRSEKRRTVPSWHGAPAGSFVRSSATEEPP
jgi:hypothetical protein